MLPEIFPSELQERLRRLRRDLHRHPELAFEEHRTASRLYAELAELQPAELIHVAGTGVLARLWGRDPEAPVVAIRGDIDALPIQEETGLEFASEVPGVMHACGHDLHASWAIGAAHLLSQSPADGDVLILLQPAEEVTQGARAVLDTGVLDGVQAIFGAHVDRRFAVGEVVAQAGPLGAAADTFSVELLGEGGHGARPHETADPVVAAASLIQALQTVVSRRLNPADPGVLSIGTLQAGNAPNVIAERVALSGTLRSLDPRTRQLLHDEVRRIAEGTASLHRLKARVEIREGPPALINPPEPVEWAREAVRRTLGEQALVPMDGLNLGGEDFAFFLERISGCFLRIGAREAGGYPIPAHTSRFYAAEKSLFVGAAALAETARIASATLRQQGR